MADSDIYVRVPEDGVGKKVYHRPKTVGADAVHVPTVLIADPTDPTITAAVSANGVAVDVKAVAGTVAVSAASLPLPSGAATAANQSTLIGHVDGVEALLTTIDSDTSTLAVVGGGVEATALRVTLANDSTGVLSVDDNGGSLTVDGTVGVSGTVAVSAASLPLPSGAATAAKQPALGTAGAASADVISVQGVASMTALKVDGSAVTQPVSGTVTANAGTGTMAVSLASVPSHAVTNAGTFAVQAEGDVAHDGVDSGKPVKIGAKAIAWGSSPTNVAADDRTNLYATLGGIQYVLATHPNVITRRDNYTTAQTNTAIVAAVASTKIVVLEATIVTDAACTAKPSAILGFHATTTPTGAGVVVSHPGIAPGSGITTRTPVASASADALLLTCAVPTGGSITVLTKYYTTGA